MYLHKRIEAVHGSELVMSQRQNSQFVSARALTANTAATSGGGPTPTSVVSSWASEYQYMMSGILPAEPLTTDYATLRPFYRDMYLLDATAGSAVDIQSTFPFSDLDVRGLKSKELQPFRDAIERLNIRRLMPEISVAYLVDGFFCGTLVFDPQAKQFMDTMIHDAVQCTVNHHPFYNFDPEIQVRVSSALQRFLSSDSPYVQRYLNTLPKVFVDLLYQGRFTLDPVATLYVPRRGLTDRANTSYLHRLLPFYLIEKTLFRGTLTEAHKRQRALTHVTAGDDTWTPSSEELNQLVQMYQQAEMDPLGGWLVTRNAVQATDIRSAGDFWKWMDVLDQLTPYKLRALGISESFLTGDASFAAAEQAYSVYIESIESYRNHLTNAVFYKKIFPLIALVNGLYKDGARKKRTDQDVISFLTDANSRADLKIPEVEWKKKLDADREEGMFDALEKLDEKGIPIPMKAWVAAAGIDFNALIADLDEDPEIRQILEEHTGKDTSQTDFDPDEASTFKFRAGPGGAPTISLNSGSTRRVPLLSRNFIDKDDGLVWATNRSGSGRRHIVNQRKARAKINDHLMKASRQYKGKKK